jgi:two-component system, LytTR family, sensor kinase
MNRSSRWSAIYERKSRKLTETTTFGFMLRAQKVYWVAQMIGWSLLCVWIYLSSITSIDGRKQEQSPNLWISIIIFFIVGITLSHTMRFLFIRWSWLNMKLGPLIPRIVLMSVFMAAVMSIVNYGTGWLIEGERDAFRWDHYILSTVAASLFLLLWNGIYFTVHFFQKSRVQEVKNLQLSASQNEIELKNLRSQLNPHFLFNSLNSIRALVDLDPIQAKENITTLSNLLRKSLILGKEQLVPLKDELDLVNDYLDLEKVRFEERLTIETRHDHRLDELPVPPFIVQTLVENAFKHGISRLIKGGKILIETRINGDKVVIRVINDGTLGKSADTGIGLQNTLRRLELLYGHKARFTLKESQEQVHATIELTHQV